MNTDNQVADGSGVEYRASSSPMIIAAKERKDHKRNSFRLCDLCVLLRLSSLVAASGEPGPSGG